MTRPPTDEGACAGVGQCPECGAGPMDYHASGCSLVSFPAPAISGEQQTGGDAYIEELLDNVDAAHGRFTDPEDLDSPRIIGLSRRELKALLVNTVAALSAPVDRGEAVAWRWRLRSEPGQDDLSWSYTNKRERAHGWTNPDAWEIQPLYLQGGSNA